MATPRSIVSTSVPSKLPTFLKDSFLGNSLYGGPLDSCPRNVNIPSESNGSRSNNKKKFSSGAIAGIGIGSVLGFLILVVILIFCAERRVVVRRRARSTLLR